MLEGVVVRMLRAIFKYVEEVSRGHVEGFSWPLEGIRALSRKNHKGFGVVATPHGVLPRDSH